MDLSTVTVSRLTTGSAVFPVCLAADRGRGFDKELQDLAAEARLALGMSEGVE